MKFSKLACLSAAGMLSLVSTQAIFAQGMIINEFSNGASGSREYLELLVLGDAVDPLTPVNLGGWVIDDNNGDFGTGGIAAGHLRIKAGALSSVPVGSLIVIYNAADRETSIPADDPTDSNGDRVYIIPHTNAIFEVCTTVPASGTPTYSGCTYQNTNGATPNATASWQTVGFANPADAPQVRKPDFSFFHGYTYGANTGTPAFPAAIGGGNSFNLGAGGGISTFSLNCGAFNSASNYTRTAVVGGLTPGAANDASNSILIQNIRSGTFNYSNLSDPNNCSLSLPIELISFTARRSDLVNQLAYTFSQVEPFSYIDIERSTDGFNFEHLYTQNIEAQVGTQTLYYIDEAPLAVTYYRLKMVDETGKITFSPIRVVMGDANANSVRLYPNPVSNELNIALGEPFATDVNIEVYNTLGQIVYSVQLPAQTTFHQLPTADLAHGTYTVRVGSAHNAWSRKFVK